MTAYLVQVFTLILIYIIVAASLNLAIGFTGLLSLGHVALFGIGAYTSAILTKDVGVPFMPAFFMAGLLSSLSRLFLTVVTQKLRGDYFAFVTLGFNFLVVALAQNWISLTRGSLGIPGIPRPVIFGLTIKSGGPFLLLTTVVTIGSLFFLYRLTRSRYGRLLEAVRDDSVGASALGKDVYRLKYQCFVVSAFFTGLAGSLFAHFIQFIDPTSFYLSDIIIVLTIVITGGLASLTGSILGGFIILAIPEILRFLPITPEAVGPLRQMIYSVILILILLFRPRGILGKVDID